jgi:hypothetical protein
MVTYTLCPEESGFSIMLRHEFKVGKSKVKSNIIKKKFHFRKFFAYCTFKENGQRRSAKDD